MSEPATRSRTDLAELGDAQGFQINLQHFALYFREQPVEHRLVSHRFRGSGRDRRAAGKPDIGTGRGTENGAGILFIEFKGPGQPIGAGSQKNHILAPGS